MMYMPEAYALRRSAGSQIVSVPGGCFWLPEIACREQNAHDPLSHVAKAFKSSMDSTIALT